RGGAGVSWTTGRTGTTSFRAWARSGQAQPFATIRAPTMEPLIRDVRRYIYDQIVQTSMAPSTSETARALRVAEGEVDAAYQALAEARAIVLRPHSSMIWMAMPFSNTQT